MTIDPDRVDLELDLVKKGWIFLDPVLAIRILSCIGATVILPPTLSGPLSTKVHLEVLSNKLASSKGDIQT